MTNTFRTWLKFNAVGALGITVQVGMLALLKSGIGLHYLPATAIAVETALLHNFVWHERWTWFERTRSTRGMLNRLARFHLANGVVSIGGNLALMWLFVARFGIGYFVANLLAIATCSIANFWASDRFVFRAYGIADPSLLVLLRTARLFCIVTWCWTQPDRAPEVREAAEYHLAHLKKAVRIR